jgi:hypothetical protein
MAVPPAPGPPRWNFARPAEVGDIAALLAENGIGYEMADLVDGVYQA